jgi:predicted transcriptional regulator/transcriptional regulator with XRE-family HTH domain
MDLVTLGQRIRHLRRAQGLTLEQLGATVGRAPSQLSMVENGRREPKLALLQAIATALRTTPAELLATEPPSRRAALEIALEHAQRHPRYTALDLPDVRPSARLPSDALESLVGLHRELARLTTEQAATPEEARRANGQLRQQMRERDNYYAEIEHAAAEVLRAIRHPTGALSQRGLRDIAEQLGFAIHYVADLPHSTRSVTDLRHRRIYLPQARSPGGHDPRAIVLQALGQFVLGHEDPAGYGDFLRQRVEANYFAAAILMPEEYAVAFLRQAKDDRALAIEDLRDTFGVSYERAAHRLTNLATHHLGIRMHFMRVHESGTIYKAYENDGVQFPTDVTGAIEGQPVCRSWAARTVFANPDRISQFAQYTDTPAGTHWCTAQIEPGGEYSITVGVPFAAAKWFRGRETTRRLTSTCPAPDCCRRPPADLAARWAGHAWPSARAHSHLLAALPPGTFPGVDTTDVYRFLQAHAPDSGGA